MTRAHFEIIAQREGPCTFPVVLAIIWFLEVYMVLFRDVTFWSRQGLLLFYYTFHIDIAICNPGHCAYSHTFFPFGSQSWLSTRANVQSRRNSNYIPGTIGMYAFIAYSLCRDL